ncbi:MAG: PadR family transcriptional regulator [Candidatus Heimdallarchaeota archaeon]|nr:PadR family transcriptional regulator [Candidatus Heimdallarchaeota archaeon]MDH5645382.1 PadR family transcriptional regulator [Candidatus Heimdallarchaeota archaeon]
MSDKKRTPEEYISFWNGRLRGSLLDLAILYQAAFSTEKVYPYSISKKLADEWGENLVPPLPTIYSAIDRLKLAGYIQTKSIAVGSRIQKTIELEEDGWKVLEMMIDEMKLFLKVFEYHEEDLDFDKARRKK